MTRTVLAAATRDEADGILGITLVDPLGASLPAWSPGAHVDLHLPSGLMRPYSLCGDPADDASYHLAVQRDPASRGGSREVHETPLLGRRLRISEPRNHFALVPARHYLFLAGGIGITPLLPMLRTAEATGTSWRLIYGARTLSAMAFREEISGRHGGIVDLLPEDSCGRPDIKSLVHDLPGGTGVYCCGPPGLLSAAEAAFDDSGKDRTDLHLERFEGAPQPMAVKGAFEVELRRSGVVLQVPPHLSILQVVREAVPDIESSCEEGVCGTCETRVLAGIPDHRDSVLTEQEQDANDVMMICVGRAKSPRLVLDL